MDITLSSINRIFFKIETIFIEIEFYVEIN